VPALVQVPASFALDEDEHDDENDEDEDGEPTDWASMLDAHAWVDVEPLESSAQAVAHTLASVEPRTPEQVESVAQSESIEQAESSVEVESSDGIDEAELARLSDALRARELDESLYERLAAWLISGAHDPTLEQALGQLGPNALQVGFDLLTQTRSG
jgi:hypothetical protein